MAWRLGVGAGWGKCDLGRGQGTSWRRNRETWWLSPGKEDTAGDEADEIGRKSRTPGGHWKLSRRSMSFYTLRPPPAACLEMDVGPGEAGGEKAFGGCPLRRSCCVFRLEDSSVAGAVG